jgi:hypothetical protein
MGHQLLEPQRGDILTVSPHFLSRSQTAVAVDIIDPLMGHRISPHLVVRAGANIERAPVLLC